MYLHLRFSPGPWSSGYDVAFTRRRSPVRIGQANGQPLKVRVGPFKEMKPMDSNKLPELYNKLVEVRQLTSPLQEQGFGGAQQIIICCDRIQEAISRYNRGLITRISEVEYEAKRNLQLALKHAAALKKEIGANPVINQIAKRIVECSRLV